MLFSPLKSGQIAAFFAKKEGGAIDVLKLMKLIYLLDRLAMQKYGYPVTFDCWVAMDKGPVPSATLNLVNDDHSSNEANESWHEWVGPRINHRVSVNRDFTDTDLNQLSASDISLLNDIWSEFGKYTKWQLVDLTHEICTEWRNPDGSSLPISEKDMLIALGRSVQDAENQARDIQEQRDIDRMFASL